MASRRSILTGTGAAAAGVVLTHGGDSWQRRRSLRTANAFYRALDAKDIDAFARLWTPDAVYRVPVTPDGTPGATNGRDAIVAGLAGFFELFATVEFTWSVEPLLDPSRVTATWAMDVGLVDGRRYVNRGISVFQMRGERIADFEEWFDTKAFLDIFGLTPAAGAR